MGVSFSEEVCGRGGWLVTELRRPRRTYLFDGFSRHEPIFDGQEKNLCTHLCTRASPRPVMVAWGGGRLLWGNSVARDGIEPSTFRFSVGRSYQLSYLAGTSKVIRIPAAPLAKTSDFLIGREHDEVTNCDVARCVEHVHKGICDVFRAHSPTGCDFVVNRCVAVCHPP